MSAVYSEARKARYRITLDLDVLGDFDPHNICWDNPWGIYYSPLNRNYSVSTRF